MFLLDLFSGNKKYKPGNKKKGKKKKKVEERRVDVSAINPIKEVIMHGFSKMGYGPKKTECQDSLCTMSGFAEHCYFLAVYDGHGSSGREASQAANDYIQTYLERGVKKLKRFTTDRQREYFLKQGFKTAESKLKNSGIDYTNSGTCCISVFIYRDKCYIANLGDSRAVLYRTTAKERQAIELSRDHKPTRPDEKDRIIRAGGRVERLIHDGTPVGPYRVWADDEGPGIAISVVGRGGEAFKWCSKLKLGRSDKMPGWPERELFGAEGEREELGSHRERSGPPPGKVNIAWGPGNKLRLSYLQQQQESPQAPSSSSNKVVEVRVGSTGTHSVTDSAMRRLVYDSLPAFALLQSRKQQVLLQSPHAALPPDWWETVLEYSRSISAVLGPHKSSFGASTKQSESKDKVAPSILKAIWDLLEIIYVDKHASSWLTEQLVSWVEGFDRVLATSEPTIYSKLAMYQPRLVNTRFPEDDEDYWDSIASALTVGWLDVVVKCLRMHGSYQHDQIDNRQTENGLVEAVTVLISKMPRMRPSSKAATLGITYTFKPDFSKAWEKWRNQIAKLNTSSFWLECTHEGTVNGLKRLLSLLLGDVDTLVAATTHWMELFVSHFLFIRPFTMVSEGLLGLARKCVQLKPPAENDHLLELLLAIIGENTEVVLVECGKLFDPWMLTHMVELLSAKNLQAQTFLSEQREVLDGMSLEESHRLVYAQLLSSHPCTWQLAPFYLASCPQQGQGLLETLLLMQPVSDRSRDPLKVLDICRMYELRNVAEKFTRTMGVHYWKHGRKGLGISWLQRGRDYERLSSAANELLTAVSQTSVGDSNRLQELDGLIDLLGPQFEGFGGLAFLHRFRDFKVALYNFQEAQADHAPSDKQVALGKEAAKHLMQLMKGSITPRKFLLPILQDSVDLLEYAGEVILTAAETNALLLRLQNLSLTDSYEDTSSLDVSSESVAKIRLALACNLGRAILKE